MNVYGVQSGAYRFVCHGTLRVGVVMHAPMWNMSETIKKHGSADKLETIVAARAERLGVRWKSKGCPFFFLTLPWPMVVFRSGCSWQLPTQDNNEKYTVDSAGHGSH